MGMRVENGYGALIAEANVRTFEPPSARAPPTSCARRCRPSTAQAKYGLHDPRDDCSDGCCALFCGCCMVCQDYKKLRVRQISLAEYRAGVSTGPCPPAVGTHLRRVAQAIAVLQPRVLALGDERRVHAQASLHQVLLRAEDARHDGSLVVHSHGAHGKPLSRVAHPVSAEVC